ncbi:hypothetical protein CRE_28010 [Caenorhabditis remanei]|uniref:Uncharacterized protein n=1 Tax=Caenorhabditis remanei TaxID=31234 RepID=E3NW13_CAERE|nr:hypothetical protein CRE_28010 [Caenorhabditis remanei]
MYYHWAYQRYPDTVAEYVKSEVALFRKLSIGIQCLITIRPLRIFPDTTVPVRRISLDPGG